MARLARLVSQLQVKITFHKLTFSARAFHSNSQCIFYLDSYGDFISLFAVAVKLRSWCDVV